MSKRKRKTKSTAQRIHAFNRFKQRTGLHFTKEVRSKFITMIKNGKTTCVQQQSLRITVHDVTYDGKVYRVIYDKNRENIVTVLPHNADIKERSPHVDGVTKAERKSKRLEDIFDKLKKERENKRKS
jgi:hypothetical protein